MISYICLSLFDLLYLVSYSLGPSVLLQTAIFHSFFYNSNISLYIYILGASLIALVVKNLPAMQDTQVRFLGWEDPLEKEMAIHSSILVWKILWTEEPGGLQSMEPQESDTTERLNHRHTVHTTSP